MPKKPKEKNTSKTKRSKEIPVKQKEKEKEKPKLKSKESTQRIKTLIVYNINHLQSNESIIKSILDKIIATAVRKANINSITNQLDDYYFDYIKFLINSMFSINNIFYSDEPENPNINNAQFWKTDYNKINTWIEIEEPSSVRCDRYENGFINFVNIQKNLTSENKLNSLPLNKEEKNPNIKKDNNIINNKKSNNLLKRFSKNIKNMIVKTNKNELDILEEKSSNESGDEENKSHTKKDSLKNNVSNSFKKNNIDNNSQSLEKNNLNSANNKSLFSQNKRQKNEILEIPSKDIPGINEEYDFEKYDPPNINFLRREREDQILRREKESKKLHFNIKNNNNNNQIIIEDEEKRIDNRKIKMFDSNRLTFDSNGKIISFKPLKIDIFSKDFITPKNSVRLFRKRKNTMRKTKKNLEEINESVKEKEKEKEKNDVENLENIIKNPMDDIEGINRNQYMKYIMEKNEKIVPSGSNFSIMLPNIGVVLKENELVKKGNREFGKFFKKYSLEDYDKILKDYVPLQNKTMMLNKMGKVITTLNKTLNRKLTNKVNSTNNMNNTLNNNDSNNLISTLSLNNNNINNNYSTMINNNSEISNPLINQENEMVSRDNEKIINNKNYNLIKTLRPNKSTFNNSLISSFNNYNNLSVGLNNKNNSFNTPKYDGSIILYKNDISSLKMELDSLQDLDYKNINNYYSPSRTRMKNINIFGRNYKDIFKNITKDKNKSRDLNELNKNIMTNKGWGSKTMSKNMSSENLLFSKHQTKYQAIREIGNKILNNIKVKLPRSRKINIQI